MQRHNAHIDSISLVARRLATLKMPVVFTGGAIVGLLLTDLAAPDVRPTFDVDVIVSSTRYADYATLQAQLRQLGFEHDMHGPNCRFTLDGLKVDIMPTEGKILGFTNRWYALAVSAANEYLLPDGTRIQLISAPIFIATKLEAFNDRGRGDFALSHDMEDIIAVIDGRPELLNEISTADGEVRRYVADYFSRLIRDRQLLDAIGMQLLPDEASQGRVEIIVARMLAISKLSSV